MQPMKKSLKHLKHYLLANDKDALQKAIPYVLEAGHRISLILSELKNPNVIKEQRRLVLILFLYNDFKNIVLLAESFI